MSTATPPARYDLPWKAAITHAFRDFMSFFFPELGQQIDWSKRPRFRDKELAGITLGAEPDTMVADKLIEVCLRNGGVKWVMVHVEVQAQRDAGLAERIHDYNYRIRKEYGQRVASLVLLADEDPDWRPRGFWVEELGTLTGISFATAKLLEYADRMDELLASDNPFALVTVAHLRTQSARHDADQLYAAKWQLTKLLFQHGWKRKRIMVLFRVINWMMALPEPYQKRYWQATLQLEKEQKMEWVTPLEQMFIDEGLRKGRQEGEQKGLQKGLQQGAAALLERQLSKRFGPLPKTVQKKLAKASFEQLEAWSDALPEAHSLKQIFT